MDSKKNLKPELKEIYERVMNTKPTARPVQPTSPTPALQALKSTPDPVASPITEPEKKSEPYLASSAPRAINDTTGFVYSSSQQAVSTKKKEEDKQPKVVAKTTEKSTTTTTTKKSNLLPIVIGLLVAFTIVYTIFWAFYLGII
jgi:cobalamin biosynthesis Mg chelatase CobN